MKCEVCEQKKHCVSIDVEWTLLESVCEECWEKECDEHYRHSNNDIANATSILFEGEADEYASVINDYPISHKDCLEILKAAAVLKGKGISTEVLIDRMIRK